ncbi:hypothetical protein [Zobellia barbeyronii]|uniref:Lipoprotein n=1 Tax=Zobellia barbeyronii TaxID=2748009 RepID=A0ABS5WJ10_9FLAO|nr:hypothetical protein [Zobellia barbeyronii]MBT2163220.1 hypothetical protein [Zobellia barbeyronii]
MKSILLVLILLFSSCKGQEKAVGNDGVAQTPDQLQLIEKDNYSGSDEEEFVVIKDVKTLQEFYSKVNRTRKPGLPVPQIDFTKEMLVIYCAGKRQNSFEPRLFVTKESEKDLVLGVKNESQKKTSTSITTPFSVYKLPLTQKKIILE